MAEHKDVLKRLKENEKYLKELKDVKDRNRKRKDQASTRKDNKGK